MTAMRRLGRLRSLFWSRLGLARRVYTLKVVRSLPSPRQRGFTLMETMITLAILSTGMLGLMAMQIGAVRGVQSAAETSLATNLAASALDDLTLMDYSAMSTTNVPGFPRKYDKQGGDLAANASDPYFTVAATVNSISGTYLDVTVTSTWRNEMNTSVNRVITLKGRVRQR